MNPFVATGLIVSKYLQAFEQHSATGKEKEKEESQVLLFCIQ
jgi:hypothetical protein